MPCIRIPNGTITYSNRYRLRLADGTCVFVDYHDYLGPQIFRDRNGYREIEEWWDNPLMCDALDWFTGRGKRA